MNIDASKGPLIQDRFHHAATCILHHSTKPTDTSQPLETEFFALEHLLKRQAQLLIQYDEETRSAQKPQNEQSIATTEMGQSKCEDSGILPTNQRDAGGPARKRPQLWHNALSTESKVDVSQVSRRLDDIESYAYQKFYAYQYDQVPAEWMCLYSDVQILQSYWHLLRLVTDHDDEPNESILDQIIYVLDHALIKTSGQSLSLNGGKWINDTIDELKAASKTDQRFESLSSGLSGMDQDNFSMAEPFGRPPVEKPVPRLDTPYTVEAFESYLNQDTTCVPLVVPNFLDSWPAMNERPWRSTQYLMSQTLGGRRLVPIEIGSSYVDEDWGQDIVSFRKFLTEYVLGGPRKDVGYLAQYELFRQIPALRNDILIPDYCWVDVKGHPTDTTKNKPKLETPNINAWFGPANTVTPLHTDGYHNLLCQVVGTKYVRLYHPSCTDALCPRGLEDGVDMSNTSSLDLGALLGWDQSASCEDEDEEGTSSIVEKVAKLDYYETVLEPGDTLLIPMGWWHYVRSTSISFSVSFWWN